MKFVCLEGIVNCLDSVAPTPKMHKTDFFFKPEKPSLFCTFA